MEEKWKFRWYPWLRMYIIVYLYIDDYRWLSQQKTRDAENTWMQISRCHDVGFVFPSQIGLEKDGSSGKQIEKLSYAVVKSLNPAVKKTFPADFGQVWCGQGTVSMWWATCDKYARHWGSSSQCLRMEHKTYLKPPTSCSIVLPCYTPRFSCNKTFQWVFLQWFFVQGSLSTQDLSRKSGIFCSVPTASATKKMVPLCLPIGHGLISPDSIEILT